jgi:hypothetical protein
MRRGFNAIEIGIVLVILGVLLALLVAAVPKVRIAAAKASCTNNLKQHGLAAHNYHDVHKHFPPGTLPNPDLPPEQRFSFLLVILPFTESTPIYAKLAKSEPWDSPSNVGVMAHYSSRLYQCPAWVRANGYDAKLIASGHTAVTHYVGVAGLGADAATRPAEAAGIGVFGYDRAAKKEDVKDGTQNTVMLIETVRDLGPWIRGGPTTVRVVEVDDVPLAGADRPFGGTHPRSTWLFQKRPDGFQVLLADGAVRYTTNIISTEVMGALATISGGEEVPGEW